MAMKVAVLLLTVLLCRPGYGQFDIVVKGLFKNTAVLEVNGVQRMIKAGSKSPEGILLISANTREAIIEIEGKRQRLELSKRIGGVEYTTPEKVEARVPRGIGGHYFTPGRINNRSVYFLVDTGATAVVLNSLMADKLGLDYLNGQRIQVQTANGVVPGYEVTLNSVAVGSVKVTGVRAIVNQGAYPTEILLGNSYLGRVEFKVEEGVLVLQAKF